MWNDDNFKDTDWLIAGLVSSCFTTRQNEQQSLSKFIIRGLKKKKYTHFKQYSTELTYRNCPREVTAHYQKGELYKRNILPWSCSVFWVRQFLRRGMVSYHFSESWHFCKMHHSMRPKQICYRMKISYMLRVVNLLNKKKLLLQLKTSKVMILIVKMHENKLNIMHGWHYLMLEG